MIGFILHTGLLSLFIFLFIREDNRDKKDFVRRDMEGDLHILKEMRKYCIEIGEDTAKMDTAIEEMQERLKSF